MTFAELERLILSKKRVMEKEDRRKASFDYILGDLIGRSVARIHNSNATYPTLAESYPSLFDYQEEEEEIQKQKDELSSIRFRQFAQFHNQKYKEVQNKE